MRNEVLQIPSQSNFRWRKVIPDISACKINRKGQMSKLVCHFSTERSHSFGNSFVM